MPHGDPDATDPMRLHGVVIETESDEAMRDMAECFVEESLRNGLDADRILGMFKTPGYAGPFLAYQTLGERAIRRVIDELLALRGGPDAETARAADGRMRLPVLES